MDLNKLFWGIAIDLQEAIKQKLSDLDIRYTSDGIGSVMVIVKDNKLIITMNGYLEYIEYGMPNPTTPEELEQWVRDKVLNNSDEKAVKRVSESIAKKITLFGPRARPFLRPVLHQELPGIIKKNISRLS